MSQAITRCPECETSFRVTVDQLLIADGSVRCGACLHLFQAEDYFVSPLLDITERLAIEADYWADFDAYLQQVLPGIANEKDQSLAISREPVVPVEPVYADFPGFEEDSEDVIEELNLINNEDVMSFYLEYIENHSELVSGTYRGLGDEESLVTVSTKVVSDEMDEESPDLYQAYLASVDNEAAQYVTIEKATIENAVADRSPLDVFASGDEFQEGPLKAVYEDSLKAAYEDSLKALDEDPLRALDLQIETDPTLLLQDSRRIFSARSLRWIPGIVMMMMAGGLQYAFFNMELFAQRASYRPAYIDACRVLHCEVPDYDNLGELRTRELVIRTHPDQQDALMVDVLLLNSAQFRQEFPGLLLRFFDIDGQIVAHRVFAVNEYLGGELRGLRYIPAETEVRLSLELVDPGQSALGYQMDVVRL